MQGDHYTEFLREARRLTQANGRKMHVHVNGVMGNVAPGFDLNNVPRSIEWQWERWIAEDLCDGITLKLLPWPWGSNRGNGQQFAASVAHIARKFGKTVVADARIQKWQLVTLKAGQAELTQADVQQVIDSLVWGWRSQAIDAITLYEVFDFVYMDSESGKVHGSPAFQEILNAVKERREQQLLGQPLQNWINE